MTCLADHILEKSFQANIIIQPIRVSSEENIYADAASRLKLPEDWSLSDRVFSLLVRRYGKPDIDLMASQMSRKAPFFLSWSKRDTEALSLDALSPDQDWSAWERLYLFPPVSSNRSLLGKDRGTESEEYYNDTSLLARQGVVQQVHADGCGGEEVAPLQVPDMRLVHRQPSTGRELVPLGRCSSFWQLQHCSQ